MSFNWDYATDLSRKTANGDGRIVPFTAKYNHGGELFPVYAPYDASSSREGIVWLTDSVDSGKDSVNGMTAITPKGVADNALLKNSKNGQTVEGDVTFKGNVTLNKPISGTAGSLTTARDITVKSGACVGGKAAFDGSKNIEITLPELDATTLKGIVPLSSIPQGAIEKIVDVKTDEDRKGLTKEKVQNWDWVRVNDGDTTYVVTDEDFLGTDRWEEAFTKMSFGKSASADHFDTAKTIELTGDVSGSDSSTGAAGWSIETTINHVKASAIKDGPIQIEQGGTGATTVAGAQANLGITAIGDRVTELANKVYENGSVNVGDGFRVVVNGITKASSDGTSTAFAGSANVGERIDFHQGNEEGTCASLSIDNPGAGNQLKYTTGGIDKYLVAAQKDASSSNRWILCPPSGNTHQFAVGSGLFAATSMAKLGDSAMPFSSAHIRNVTTNGGGVTAKAMASGSSNSKAEYTSPGIDTENNVGENAPGTHAFFGIDKDGYNRGVHLSGEYEDGLRKSDGWALYADKDNKTHAQVDDITIDKANNKTDVENFLSKLNIRMGASTDSIPSTGWNTATGAPVDGCIFIKYE